VEYDHDDDTSSSSTQSDLEVLDFALSKENFVAMVQCSLMKG
jgi:hypothetical protein